MRILRASGILKVGVTFVTKQWVTNGTPTVKIPLALIIINYFNYVIHKKVLKKVKTPLKSVNLTEFVVKL